MRPGVISADCKAMTEIKGQEDGDPDIRRQEIGRVPSVLQEDLESVQQEQEREHGSTDPSHVRLESRAVG